MPRGLRRSLTSISVTAALLTIGNWGSVPAANADDVAPSVVLYDAAEFDASFGQTTISQSMPDLARIGWSGRVSSLRIRAGISVAVYSEINYQGTCSTFVGHDAWLGNDRIGNDSARSVRFFHDCAGPVIDPVVTAMTTVNGGPHNGRPVPG